MNPFSGTYTAIVTPFKKGVLDEDARARLLRAQIRGGVDGIVPVGTTARGRGRDKFLEKDGKRPRVVTGVNP